MEEVPHGDVPSCCLAAPAELRMGKDIGPMSACVVVTNYRSRHEASTDHPTDRFRNAVGKRRTQLGSER